ncbi:hypothetical protein D915_008899 [Fasciola hepatica]|uniref:Saposin B-type domain-containing protein n=1 Tax=Fasciola hepatica TaxID=6192 RepID=A0A4E0RGK1_FASHE|nr:hypothetical protein D915_008899 [Fasciola hepatica]
MYAKAIFVFVLLSMIYTVRAERLQSCWDENEIFKDEIDNIDKCPACRKIVDVIKSALTSDDVVRIEKEGFEYVCGFVPVGTNLCKTALHKVVDIVVKKLKAVTPDSFCKISQFSLSVRLEVALSLSV